MSGIDTSRIDHLLGDRDRSRPVVIIGLGSGGFPVFQHLAMSGWWNFVVMDPDKLEQTNLVKHPALRSELGRSKTSIARQWLADRNPVATCETVEADVMALPEAQRDELIAGAAMVVSATDSNAARHFINDLCVRHATPMTVGLVHRGGVGGTVLAYRPGTGGCYACMETVAEGLGQHLDDEMPLTDDESELIYGRNLRSAAAAGLSSDIALTAAVHAQLTIDELLRADRAEEEAPNWISLRFRRDHALSLEVNSLALPMIDDCVSCAPVLSPNGGPDVQ